ncbi:MAG TPA: Gfo/Idh/MocA family oxidoreductase [Planctomycetota bacterium]|nr:Gfo/Idh/MocA family oxidoreductase [Planctomycetota bacterium]
MRALSSRRSFFKTSAAFAAAPLFAPRAWSSSPAETLNVACVGVGNMGHADLHGVRRGKNVRIVALCDVDEAFLGKAAAEHPDARTFRDYRRMLDAMERDVDAVVVSTPDHMHAAVALAAMRRGKHVYCQKPLAHSLHECRRMAEVAAREKVVTQMGIQIHAHPAYRTAVAALRGGVIGKVRAVHSWVGKSWAGPAEGRPERTDEVPDSLAWDLWLGVAPARSFVHGLYHPAQWRGWTDFGTGTLGDMGCHILDPVCSALDLGAPVAVRSHGPAHRAETFAPDGDVRYEFAGTAFTDGAVTVRWTDGAARPDVSGAGLPADLQLPAGGSLLLGTEGVMLLPHWAMPTVWRDGEVVADAFEHRPGGDHYCEWTDACRGEGTTSTPFSYAGPLSETVLVGVVAGRFPGTTLRWDSAALQFDHAPANAFVTRTYREGWAIE